MSLKIYFPMTANILTPGHIRCIKELEKRGKLVVGILNSTALRGYKKEIVPFRDRLYIVKSISKSRVVSQNSLNPSANIRKFNCNTLASGDGFEHDEISAAKKLGVKLLNVKLKGEKTKKYSSSKILKKMV